MKTTNNALRTAALGAMVLAMSLLPTACMDEEQVTAGRNGEDNPALNNVIINHLLGHSLGAMDAVQVLAVNSAPVEYDGSSDNWYSSLAAAVYNVGGMAGTIEDVKINGSSIHTMPNAFPVRYLNEWMKNTGPGYGDNVQWQATVEVGGQPRTFTEEIPVPPGFGTPSFSSATLDMDVGGVLSWSGSTSGQVGIGAHWLRLNATETGVEASDLVFLKLAADNGSASISPQDLAGAGIPADADMVTFYLVRMNVKTQPYVTNNLATIAYVEQHVGVDVE